jgi:hypothetical protein
MDKKNIILLFITITVIFLCRDSFADIYMYTDSNGQVNFTDVPPNKDSKPYIKEKNIEKSEKVPESNKLNHNGKSVVNKTQPLNSEFSVLSHCGHTL